jgi:hypothetical protein
MHSALHYASMRCKQFGYKCVGIGRLVMSRLSVVLLQVESYVHHGGRVLLAGGEHAMSESMHVWICSCLSGSST